MKCPSEVQKAYVAGFVDGEGSIGIYRSGTRTNGCRASVCIYNNKVEVLHWINSLYDGWICKKPKLPQHRQAWSLAIQKKDKCLRILEDIYPYLILKRKQAELVMEFCRTETRRMITERDIEILNEIRVLNMRGEKSSA